MHIKNIKKHHIILFTKSTFWFLIGAILGLFFLVSFTVIFFQQFYGNKIYPGVVIDNVDFGGKTQQEVENYFLTHNKQIQDTQITFAAREQTETTTAKLLHIGYDNHLLAQQAYSVGRSGYLFSNITLVLQAYTNSIHLPPSYTISDNTLTTLLTPIMQKEKITPVDAVFKVENNRVTAFHPSLDGQEVNTALLKQTVTNKIPALVSQGKNQTITIVVPLHVLKPAIATDDVNHLGIHELIGTGTSLFAHSIPSRIYNVTLAATRENGVLISPNEVFSFDKALVHFSKFPVYKEAYVIENGKTVLGDGGGICQISTTFFRALLNAGLPIVERHGHAYRVGYYEEDSPPGIDATVYVPSVDLKFKNDTGHYILAQSIIDPENLRVTVLLYGTKDGRVAEISTPVITNQTPAPDPLTQDDPTLPKGEVKQIDFAAAGAHVYFTRQVKKANKVFISETYTTDYQPWKAVYLRGTKE